MLKGRGALGPGGRFSRCFPSQDGHPNGLDNASAASRIESRTDPSHSTPRRHIGAGEARDWPHLPEPE
jgi:hypothetical protein